MFQLLQLSRCRNLEQSQHAKKVVMYGNCMGGAVIEITYDEIACNRLCVENAIAYVPLAPSADAQARENV